MAKRNRRKEKSGVVVYFDIEPAIARLSDSEKGKLLTAMLQYSHYGVVPDFGSDSVLLALTWDFIQPKIDYDSEAWEDKCIKGMYAAYCREAEKQEKNKLDFDTWYQEIYLTSDDVIGCHVQPNTITIPSTITEPLTEPITKPSTKGECERESTPFAMPEVYKQPSESEFEEMRRKGLEMLSKKQNCQS